MLFIRVAPSVQTPLTLASSQEAWPFTCGCIPQFHLSTLTICGISCKSPLPTEQKVESSLQTYGFSGRNPPPSPAFRSRLGNWVCRGGEFGDTLLNSAKLGVILGLIEEETFINHAAYSAVWGWSCLVWVVVNGECACVSVRECMCKCLLVFVCALH